MYKAIFYQKNVNNSLKICEVQEKSLKNYVTGKKEKKKDSSYSKMDEKYLIDTSEYIKKILKKRVQIPFFQNNKIIR